MAKDPKLKPFSDLNDQVKHKAYLYLVVTSFFIAYVLGVVYPSSWWGTNYLVLLSPEQKALFILATIVLLTLPESAYSWLLNRTNSNLSKWIVLILSLGYGILAFTNPIAYDPYGDAVYFHEGYEKVTQNISAPLELLFTFSMDAWAGEKTFLALVETLSFFFQIDALTSFRLIDAISGFVFAWAWIGLVHRRTNKALSKIALILAGLTSPFALIFFGRTEIYSIPIVLGLLWSIQLIRYSELRSRYRLGVLILCSLIFTKFHPIGLLTIPVVFAVSISQMKSETIQRSSWIMPFAMITIPVFVSGLVLYFIVLQDHIDDRVLSGPAVMQYDHLFLPIFSPDPPRHLYNLFGWNHFLDFTNVLLLMCPAGLFAILIGAQILIRKNISPAVFFLGTTLFMFLSLLFAINPLLTMPLDWDLYTICVPFILCLAVLTSHSNVFVNRIIILLSIISLSFVVIHRNTESIADRLELIGYHVYGTYYEWTASILDRSVNMRLVSTNDEIEIRSKQIETLGNMNNAGKDQELSTLYKNLAKVYLRKKNDFSRGEDLLKTSKQLNQGNKNARLLLTEAYFGQKEYRLAYHEAVGLLEFKSIPLDKTRNMIVQCALEAKMYQEALFYCNRSDSPLLNEIALRITKNDRIDELALMFQSSANSDQL